MKKLIVNEQGEQYIDLTPAEITQREQDATQAEVDRVAREEKIATELANKQSALTKLSALGLTEAEIKAIIGN
jgi:pyrroloquinoline quinone (PQQ) biosynthesis protein C